MSWYSHPDNPNFDDEDIAEDENCPECSSDRNKIIGSYPDGVLVRCMDCGFEYKLKD